MSNSSSSFDRLVMYHSESMIAFKKEKSHSSKNPILICRRDQSEITIAPATQDLEAILEDKKFKISLIPALVGILKLNSGVHFICVTAAEPVGELRGATIYKAGKFKLIRSAPNSNGICLREARDDDRYVGMVEKYLNSKHFYFAYEYDLTQLIAKQPSALKIENCNSKFLYNSFLVACLGKQVKKSLFASSAASSEEFADPSSVAISFCIPLIQGFLQTRDFSIEGQNMKLTLISRRAPSRSGTRFHCRGADESGNVSNSVETEQILQTPNRFFCFAQYRGSIPFGWGQQINIKYKPKLFICQDRMKNKEMAKCHFSSLASLYGKPIVAVSLINRGGYEKPLVEEFTRIMECEELKDEVKYLHIDFHHECKTFGWNRLDEITTSLRRYFEPQGYWEIDSHSMALLGKQCGIMRINCVDCLDRTNVFMGLIGKLVLLKQLAVCQIIPEDCNSLEGFPAAEKTFKSIWADNADAISQVYAGTAALKSDFTRLGKRTLRGVLADPYKSFLRYWLNNFNAHDGHDASLLLTGGYRVIRGSESPFKTKFNPKKTALKAALCYLLAIQAYYLIIVERGLFKLKVLATFVILASYTYWCFSTYGKLFVCNPRLFRNFKPTASMHQ